jgi:hypothetical protein
LRVDLESIFSLAREEIRARCADASLVTGDVVAAWQAVGTAPAEAAPSVTGRLLRRARPSTAATDPYESVADALREAVASLLRVQLDQALFRIAERWSAAPSVAPSGLRRLTRLSEDLDARVDTALGEWLASVDTRVKTRLDSANPAHGNGGGPGRSAVTATTPAALAVATLAVEGRPVRGTGDRHRVVDIVEGHLTHLPGDTAAALGREAWLDLISALNSVLLQDETRLADALDATDLLPEASERLRAAAEAVSRARHRDDDRGQDRDDDQVGAASSPGEG